MSYTTATAVEAGPDAPESAVILVRAAKKGRRTSRPANGLAECREHCVRHGYRVDGTYIDDGPKWTLERASLNPVMSYLVRCRPPVLVIRDWTQIATRREDRDKFAAKMERLGIRVESVHRGEEPGTVWDSNYHARQRVGRRSA